MRRSRAWVASAALILGLGGCVDFVEPERTSPQQPAASLVVRSMEEADSVVVRVAGTMIGFGEAHVTLAGVAASVTGGRGDTLRVLGSAWLPVGAEGADLTVPFAPWGAGGRVLVRVGIVRRAGPPTLEGADLVLPWSGPRVVAANSDWSVTLERDGEHLVTVFGSGSPARPLRVPLSLFETYEAPTTARMTLTRRVEGDAYYPLHLRLTGETSWALPEPPLDP